jgi:hypothetical protein
MGNRDKRGREKKKPKKTEVKPTAYRPVIRPAAEYKPPAPAPTPQEQPAAPPVKTP